MSNDIGRNDPCPCNSGKKYKKCCLIKLEQDQATANKLANDDFEKWFAEDQKIGLKNMAEATLNPPLPVPAFDGPMGIFEGMYDDEEENTNG